MIRWLTDQLIDGKGSLPLLMNGKASAPQLTDNKNGWSGDMAAFLRLSTRHEGITRSELRHRCLSRLPESCPPQRRRRSTRGQHGSLRKLVLLAIAGDCFHQTVSSIHHVVVKVKERKKKSRHETSMHLWYDDRPPRLLLSPKAIKRKDFTNQTKNAFI